MDGEEIGRRIDELRRELDALSAAAVEGAAATEASQPMPKRARRRVRRSIVFAVLLVTLAIPGVVLASHQFSDVPNSNTFHNSISNIKIAGITGGCGGTKYCPNDPVTRGQMAAFLNRGLGRGNVFLASGVTLDTSYGVVVEGAVRTPGSGFVLVNVASMAYSNDASGCPCEVDMQIRDETTNDTSFFYGTTVPSVPAATWAYGQLSNTHVFPVTGAGFHQFAAEMAANIASFSGDASMTLIWIPFDEEGLANQFTTTQQQPTQQHR